MTDTLAPAVTLAARKRQFERRLRDAGATRAQAKAAVAHAWRYRALAAVSPAAFLRLAAALAPAAPRPNPPAAPASPRSPNDE